MAEEEEETDIETLEEIDNPRYWCCPFDINHTMPKDRLFNHLAKCKPNKPFDFSKYTRLVCQASHYILKGHEKEHYEACLSNTIGSAPNNLGTSNNQHFEANLTENIPVDTYAFLEELDRPISNPVFEIVPKNPNHGRKNKYDPSKNYITRCRACNSVIRFNAKQETCNVCFLLHPQICTETTKKYLLKEKQTANTSDQRVMHVTSSARRHHPYSKHDNSGVIVENPKPETQKTTTVPSNGPMYIDLNADDDS